MTRKGREKVRTGCRTCKLRKVKCDETRPQCVRCKNTGRKCDGYARPPPGSYSWGELLCPPPLTDPNTGPVEMRSLSFFRHAAAPFLAVTLDSLFWTRRVLQLAAADPAVKHAVLAIGSLYEQFENSVLDGVVMRGCDKRRWRGSNFALYQYNMAIRRVMDASFDDVELLLVVSLLFTCIEFLQGNAERAITHCRHGIQVYNSFRLHSDVAELFSHLSIFPVFFGGTVDEFPLLQGRVLISSLSTETVALARESLDYLLRRTVRLIREADKYRLGLVDQLADGLSGQEEQQCILQELDAWMQGFAKLQRSSSTGGTVTALRMLEMRWLVCKTWASACLERTETIYDDYMDVFRRIVEIAREESVSKRTSGQPPPKFTFEMGFAPLLHIVVLKCRCLNLRLEALSLLKHVSSSRETLWDANILYAIGKRFIEIEHSLYLGSEQGCEEARAAVAQALTRPKDDARIRDSVLGEETEVALDDDGQKVIRRRIRLFMPCPGGGVRETWDWIRFEGQCE